MIKKMKLGMVATPKKLVWKGAECNGITERNEELYFSRSKPNSIDQEQEFYDRCNRIILFIRSTPENKIKHIKGLYSLKK